MGLERCAACVVDDPRTYQLDDPPVRLRVSRLSDLSDCFIRRSVHTILTNSGQGEDESGPEKYLVQPSLCV